MAISVAPSSSRDSRLHAATQEERNPGLSPLILGSSYLKTRLISRLASVPLSAMIFEDFFVSVLSKYTRYRLAQEAADTGGNWRQGGRYTERNVTVDTGGNWRQGWQVH